MTTNPPMPERISFFASRVATTLFEAGHIDQRNHAKVSKVVALMVNDELAQSLLRESGLREALEWYEVCHQNNEGGGKCHVDSSVATKALSTTTPPTDRIVVTREMVEKLHCTCSLINPNGVTGPKDLVCPRCQLLAQFPSEQPTKAKGE